MPINKIMIEKKINDTKVNFEVLNRIIMNPVDEFINDRGLQLQGERIFELITLTMLDICTHIISNVNVETPTSYSDCMYSLEKIGILDDNETADYISLIKMRNLVVHQYGRIDQKLLFKALTRLESTFTKFKNKIINYLENSS